MSTLNVNEIQHSTGTGNNIVLNADGDTQVNSLNSGQLAGFRNQLISGDFSIWQRGTTFTTPNGTAIYLADRWLCNTTTAGIGLEQRTQNSPPGFAYSLRTDGGSDNKSGNNLCQSIELPGAGLPGPFALNSVWTISYYLNAQNLTKLPVLKFLDADNTNGVDVTVSDLAVVPGYESISVGGQTWTRYQAKVTIDAAPAATNIRLRVGIFFGNDGETIETRRITGCMLEPGPVATPFEHRPISTEIALCQRYFYKLNPSWLGPVSLQIGADDREIGNMLPVPAMRAEPTFANVGGSNANEVQLLQHSAASPKTHTVNSCKGTGPVALMFAGQRDDMKTYMYRPQGNIFHFDAEL